LIIMGKFATTVAAVAAALCAAGAGVLDAQAPRSYTWYAELASLDQSAKTITVTVQIRDGVTTYVGGYKPGDKLMLTWVPIKGEADTVIYAPKYEVMKGIDEGYILPVEFVSADPAKHTLTVKTSAPDAVLQSVRAVQPGKWIKVVVPMQQPKETAALTSAAMTEKPDLKPPPPPPAPTPTADTMVGRGRGRARGGAQPDAAAPAAGAAAPDGGTAAAAGAGGPMAGTWVISSQLAGNAVNSDCTFALEGPKITGSCGGPLGKADVTGVVNGVNVSFEYSVTYSGMPLTFAYTGTIDPGTNELKGTVTVFGMEGEFTGKKK
jgi:hypothetical protein